MKEQSDITIKRFLFQETQKWTQELKENGVVVIKSIISPEEVQSTITLFWQWLEAIGTGIKRNSPQTWNQKNWPGMKYMGFFSTYGGCHTKASWFLRCHTRVKKVFSQIWQTDQLITSFDTLIGWKPWWMNKEWLPNVQNLHVDQNPFFKKGFKCVQGMIPLKRVRKDQIGGLMIVPKTNNDQTQKKLSDRYPGTRGFPSDWLQLNNNDPYMEQGQLVECDAGDFILWDSRTIHGGKVCSPSEEFKQKNKNDFVRLSQTITMMPRSKARQEVLEERKKAFMNKTGHTHWANEANKSGMGGFISAISRDEIKYDWPEFTQEIAKLV